MRLYSVGSWCRRHPDLSTAIGLAVVALALMSPYLFRPDVLVWPRSGLGTDFLNYRWSHVYHLRQSLRENGQVPLWRGTVMGGEPMIGNPTVMLFYPPQFLVALLPVPIMPSFAFLTALHLWIAGMGTYVLTHKAIGVRRLAAFLAALAMTLTPRLSSNAVGDIGMDYAICWAPFCLAWAVLAFDRRRVSWAILTGLGLAFQFLLHVHIFYYTAWAIGLRFVYQVGLAIISARRDGWARERLRHGLAQAGLLALMVLVCTALVSFELLPFVTYLKYLSRESMTLAEANYYALPPSMLISFLMPSSLKFPEWELYVGLLPIVLLPFAVLHPRRREVVFWIGLAVFAALFSLGSATPLFSSLFCCVPGFRWLRVPARMWLLVTIAMTALTGLAVDMLSQWPTRSGQGRWWQNWILIGGWTLVLTTLVGRWITRRAGEYDWLLGFVGAAGLVLGLVGIWLWLRTRIRLETLGTLLVGALLLDLFPVDVAYMGPMPVARAFDMPAIGQSLLDPQIRAQDPFRVYAVRGEIPYHIAMQESLELVDGINSFQFASYVAFAKQATGCDLPGFAASMPPCLTNEISSTAYLDANPDPALLGLFNVRYVIAPMPLDGAGWALRDSAGGTHLYENLHVQPRAFGVGRADIVTDDRAARQRLGQIDVSTVALVEAGEVDWPAPQEDFHVPARSVDRQPNRLRVEIDMPGDGVLVLGEMWTPGWRATDNGTPARVLRVDGALRGVYLERGSHEVVFRFAPRSFTWGLGISALAVLACVAALLWDRVPPKKWQHELDSLE